MAQITPGLFDISGMLPALTQGFTKLGAAPEAYRRRGMLDQIMQASPAQQGQLIQQEGVRTGNLELALKGQQMEQAALTKGAEQGIEALITQIADPKTDDALVESSRQTALQLARDNNVPEAQVREALDKAQKRRLTVNYDAEIQKIKGFSLAAKKLLGVEGGKEKFIQQAGEEYGFVFDEINTAYQEQQANLAIAADKRRNTEFTYTDEELKGMGLSANTIKGIRALPSNLNKNAAVYNAVKSLGAEVPTAALLNFYAKSLVDPIMQEKGWKYRNPDRVKEAEAIATRRAREQIMSGAGAMGLANAVVDAQSQAEEQGVGGMSGADIDAAMAELMKEVQKGN